MEDGGVIQEKERNRRMEMVRMPLTGGGGKRAAVAGSY
jgi:hypothetical protein